MRALIACAYNLRFPQERAPYQSPGGGQMHVMEKRIFFEKGTTKKQRRPHRAHDHQSVSVAGNACGGSRPTILRLPAMLAWRQISFWRGQKRGMMPDVWGQIGNSGLNLHLHARSRHGLRAE